MNRPHAGCFFWRPNKQDLRRSRGSKSSFSAHHAGFVWLKIPTRTKILRSKLLRSRLFRLKPQQSKLWGAKTLRPKIFRPKLQLSTPDLKGKCQIAVGTTGPQPQGPDRSRHFIPDIIRHATTQHNHKRATHNSQSTMHSPCANRQLQTQSQTQHHKHNHTPSTANTTTNNRKRTTTSATRPTNTIISAPTTTKAQPHQLPVCVKK